MFFWLFFCLHGLQRALVFIDQSVQLIPVAPTDVLRFSMRMPVNVQQKRTAVHIIDQHDAPVAI